ncbi:MAG: alpha-amylase family glycosyl hydrolase [Candidatus Cyclobacteriaceae bacterium M2_1C_046]
MRFFILLLCLLSISSLAQVTVDPAFPKADQPLTITVDVSGTALEGYTDPIWIWSWIAEGCASNCDAATNVNPATDAQSDALMTRSATDPNIYTITFTPTVFFNKTADQIKSIGFLLKGQDWSNGQTQDFFIDISEGGLDVKITAPKEQPLFLTTGEVLTISATASEIATMTIYINENVIASETSVSSISHDHTAGAEGEYKIKVTADNGTEIAEDSTTFIVYTPSVVEPRPTGVIAGINYFNNDPTRVILDLWAPNKSFVYVVGDFNNWEAAPEYQMKQDGEHFWLEITGLEPGVEYGFQYLVDGSVYIADPYADKILDPDDHYIPESHYPGLQDYPAGALHGTWFFNRVSVLETGQTPYQWQNEPVTFAEDSLIIYELLIRDFFEDGNRTYADLQDTLSYFKNLGINAIQLMPVMEFNGNISWGYNPTFMFAPDKYYGPKENLKALIDAAHGLDIAVILDITLNHQDIPNSFLMMYFDFQNFKPLLENPWFNVDAKHPFNVFFDMDHESPYTQQYLDTVNHYWLNEYKVDGFRYDLSKGFTQKESGEDVGLWSSYDATRIALLKRMRDEIRIYDEDAILILEHFGSNTEEKELSSLGFLLWGHMNHSYSQVAMGYPEDTDLAWGYYENRGWENPHLVTYMESHDEERVGYRVKEFGNRTADYSTRPLPERIERLKGAALFLYTIPGPKMMWQWGEWGYDVSIEFDGRLGIKPTPVALGYLNEEERIDIFNFYQALLNLRKEKVFNFGAPTFANLGNNPLLKQITIRNDPYNNNPSTVDEMNVVIVGNFDVVPKQVNISFPHLGNWYSYFTTFGDLNVNNPISITLQPGEFRLYTDVRLEKPADLITEVTDPQALESLHFYPNPVEDKLSILVTEPSVVTVFDLKGLEIMSSSIDANNTHISLSSVPKGVYLVEVQNRSGKESFKIIKK